MQVQITGLGGLKLNDLQRVSVFWLILSPCAGNAYNQEERVVCAGYDNGDIKLFDLKTMSLRWETNIKNGVREP